MFLTKCSARLTGAGFEKHELLLLTRNGNLTSQRFLSPLQVYLKKVEEKQLLPDKDQEATAEKLEHVYNSLKNYQPSPVKLSSKSGKGLFGGLFKKDNTATNSIQLLNNASPKGLYIYGSVGGGKTTLMDMFYDCCTNVRFAKIKKNNLNTYEINYFI